MSTNEHMILIIQKNVKYITFFFKIKITGFTDIQNKVLCKYLIGPRENFFSSFI